MDRSWITTTTKPGDPEYQQGVKEFIKFAFENSGGRSKLRCPCFMCHNFLHKRPDEILNHLNKWAFDRTYTHWIWHGERRDMHAGDSGETRDNVCVVHDVDEGDQLEDMLHAVEDQLDDNP
uniref:Transposase-associated domain-containing protein n=1 Tax=Chenopodium quinoa TaxID=63459 RepID=A0A803M6R8_CHEQI